MYLSTNFIASFYPPLHHNGKGSIVLWSVLPGLYLCQFHKGTSQGVVYEGMHVHRSKVEGNVGEHSRRAILTVVDL